MAVDTAQKRFSMLNFGTDDNQMLFQVDGAVDLDDRQHLIGCYSGIAFGAPGGFNQALIMIDHIRNFNKGLTGGMR